MWIFLRPLLLSSWVFIVLWLINAIFMSGINFFVSWLLAYSYNSVLSEILAKNDDFFDFFQKYLWFSINRCFRQKVQILGVEFNSKWDTGNRVQVSLFNFSCEISFILVIQPCFGAFPAFLDDLCKVLYGGSSWPPPPWTYHHSKNHVDIRG